jgi:hypothetical protein
MALLELAVFSGVHRPLIVLMGAGENLTGLLADFFALGSLGLELFINGHG